MTHNPPVTASHTATMTRGSAVTASHSTSMTHGSAVTLSTSAVMKSLSAASPLASNFPSPSLNAFSSLAVPKVVPWKAKAPSKVPKHLSGNEALAYFEGKRLEKEKKEQETQRKRLVREEKRREKEQLKNQQEEKKKSNKSNGKGKSKAKSKAIQRLVEVTDSDRDISVQFMDSDNAMETEEPTAADNSKCPKCQKKKNDIEPWIKCSTCRRFWHVYCTGDETLVCFLDDLENIDFVCLLCSF